MEEAHSELTKERGRSELLRKEIQQQSHIWENKVKLEQTVTAEFKSDLERMQKDYKKGKKELEKSKDDLDERAVQAPSPIKKAASIATLYFPFFSALSTNFFMFS